MICSFEAFIILLEMLTISFAFSGLIEIARSSPLIKTNVSPPKATSTFNVPKPLTSRGWSSLWTNESILKILTLLTLFFSQYAIALIRPPGASNVRVVFLSLIGIIPFSN